MASLMLLEARDCLEVNNLGLVWLTRNITQNLLDKNVSRSSKRSITLTKRLPIKYQFLMGFRETKIKLLSPIPMVAAMQLDPSQNIPSNQLLDIIPLMTHGIFIFNKIEEYFLPTPIII